MKFVNSWEVSSNRTQEVSLPSSNSLTWCNRSKTESSRWEAQVALEWEAKMQLPTNSYKLLSHVADWLTFKPTQKCLTSCACWKNTAVSAKNRATTLKLEKLAPNSRNSSVKKPNVRRTILEPHKNKSFRILKQPKRPNSSNSPKLGITTWVITKQLHTWVWRSLR